MTIARNASAAWLAALLLAASASAELPVLLGDLNADARLSVADAVRLAGHLQGSAPLPPELRPYADLTRDATSDPADASALRQAIVGRAPATPFFPSLTTLLTSPADGEEGVAVTRETIVRLSYPLAEGEVVTGADVFVSFDGSPRPSTIVVAPDRSGITLFHPSLLPGAARVRLTVIGDGLMDAAGRAVDADGDGVAGGTAEIDFDTLGLTALPGTIACGRVFASELAPGPGGTSINVGLEGVHIAVDGAPHLNAVTDAMGSFRMDPAPAGRFFVHVDARPVQDGVPPGAYYPYVGKPWETVPGQESNVGDVYLPLVLPGTLQQVSAASATPITFVDAYTDEHPELEGVSVTVPADSLYADDGQRGGSVGIAPVPPDRLPGTLPEGLDFDLVITVQTDGATNFATPVPACFPTPTDPTTGELLQPGDKSTLWSFNHDAGRWEAIGAMTVTPDGRLACTDPGVGIEQPGWHGTLPGYTASGGETVFGGGGGGDEPVAEVAGYEPSTTTCPPAATFCTACIPGSGVPAGVTDPVHLFSGELQMREEDLVIPGVGMEFRWVRTYRSQVRLLSAQGQGWVHGYDIGLEEAGPDLRLIDGGSRQDIYRRQPDGTWGRAETFRVITREPDGRYVMTFEDRTRWVFHPLDGSASQGRIAGIEDRNGNALGFAYGADGRLATVIDTLGRNITVEHDANGFVSRVRDFEGREVRYQYYANGDAGGGFGDLRSVTSPSITGTPNGNDFPAGRTRTYTYTKGFADDRLNHNLLSVTDGRRNDPSDPTFGQGPYVTNVYATTQDPTDPLFDRVVRQVWGGGVIDLVYVATVPGAGNRFAVMRTIVNDRVGNVSEYLHDAANRLVLLRRLTGRAAPASPTTETTNRPAGKLRPADPDAFDTVYEYNADSLVTRIVMPNGNEIRYEYEADLNPGAPPQARGNLRRLRRLAGAHVPAGDQPERVEEFEYLADFSGCCGSNFVTRHVDWRGNVTTNEYDASGNLARTVHPIPSIVEDFEHDSRGRMTAHVWPPDAENRRRRDEFQYHASGPGAGFLRAAVADAGGLALTTVTERDARGNVTRRVDPRGNDELMFWNALDEIVRWTSPETADGAGDRHSTDWFRDANGNVVREEVENRDETGALQANATFAKRYEHDVLDRVVRATLEADAGREIALEWEYDLEGNQVLARSGEAVAGRQPDAVVRTDYDERDMTLAIVQAPGSPLQSTMRMDYDANGNLVRVVEGLEAEPRTWSFEWDGHDRLRGRIDPMGNALVLGLDPAGNVVATRREGQLVDAPGSAGNVRLASSTATLDAMGRLVAARHDFFDPATQAPVGDGASDMAMTWDGLGNVVEHRDDNGHASVVQHDSAGRVRRVTDPRGNGVEYQRDANGNVVVMTETDLDDTGGPPRVMVSTYDYDNLDRLVRATDPLGNVEDAAYDSRGNLVLLRDALRASPGAPGNVVRHAYDGLDRLVSTTRTLTLDGTGATAPAGSVTTSYSWDDDSRLIAVTDGAGNTTRWSFDALSRPVGRQLADGTSRTAEWNVHGEAVATTDANGTRIELARDLLGRVTGMDISPGAGVSADTTTVAIALDGQSRIVRAEDDDSLVTRAHDSLGGLFRETTEGLVLSRTLDAVGNVLTATLPSGRVLETSYDELDRPVSVRDGSGPVVAYDWIGRGRLARRTLGNGVVQDVAYDAARRPVRSTHVAPGSVVLVDEAIEWDAMSRVSALQDMRPGGIRRELGHDSLGRLVRSSSAIPPAIPETVSYAYDAVGNRTLVTGGADAGAYALSPSAPTPADRQVNQYTTTPFDAREYDAEGRLSRVVDGGGERRFTYDAAGRLVQHASPSATTTLTYDPLGRRLVRAVAGPVPSSVRYAWDGWDEVEERDAVSGSVLATHVNGPWKDAVVQTERPGSSTWMLADALLHVRATADDVAAVSERYEYEDFGLPAISAPDGTPRTGSAVDNAFRFSGRRHDDELGLSDARTRLLDPRAGRFTTRDAIGTWGDERNLGNGNAYVGNDPWSLRDPFGTCSPPDPDWDSLVKKLQDECNAATPAGGNWQRVRRVVPTHQEYLAYIRQIEAANPAADWRAIVVALHEGSKQSVDIDGSLPIVPIKLFVQGDETTRGRQVKLPDPGLTTATPGGKRVKCPWDIVQVSDPQGKLVDITHVIAGLRADFGRDSGFLGMGIGRGFMLRANTSWGDGWQRITQGPQPDDQWLGDDVGISMAHWYRDDSHAVTPLSTALQQFWQPPPVHRPPAGSTYLPVGTPASTIPMGVR